MHALNTDKKVVLWLLLLCSLLLAPLAARADVVTDWNMTAIRAAQAAGQPAPMFARNMAMVHAAIYDAINAIDRRHTAYAVDIKAKPGASIDAAAAAAAYGVLTKLYWTDTPAFEVALEGSLAAIPDGPARADGPAVGNEVAEVLMALRKDDRSNATVTYTPKSDPGVYQLTPARLRASGSAALGRRHAVSAEEPGSVPAGRSTGTEQRRICQRPERGENGRRQEQFDPDP